MTLNAADRKSVRRAEKDAALADRQRLDNIRDRLSTSGGRLYLWGELSAAHIFQTSMSPDPLQMAFLEGERNMGLRLLNDILAADPNQFVIMWREASGRDTNEQPRGPDVDRDDSGSDSSDDSSSGYYDHDDTPLDRDNYN